MVLLAQYVISVSINLLTVLLCIVSGRQWWTFCWRRQFFEDQQISSVGSCQLGNGLCHAKEAWSLYQSVPLSTLDIYSHEGETLDTVLSIVLYTNTEDSDAACFNPSFPAVGKLIFSSPYTQTHLYAFCKNINER